MLLHLRLLPPVSRVPSEIKKCLPLQVFIEWKKSSLSRTCMEYHVLGCNSILHGRIKDKWPQVTDHKLGTYSVNIVEYLFLIMHLGLELTVICFYK